MTGDAIPSFSAMLRTALEDALAPDAATFPEMFAEDGVMEFPFAPPGMTTRLDGRAAVEAHLASLEGMITFDGMGAPTVHRASDVFVLEFEGRGHGVKTYKPYNQTYISVVRLERGRIMHYRDYWNPLVILDAMTPSPSSPDGRDAV